VWGRWRGRTIPFSTQISPTPGESQVPSPTSLTAILFVVGPSGRLPVCSAPFRASPFPSEEHGLKPALPTGDGLRPALRTGPDGPARRDPARLADAAAPLPARDRRPAPTHAPSSRRSSVGMPCLGRSASPRPAAQRRDAMSWTLRVPSSLRSSLHFRAGTRADSHRCGLEFRG